MRDFEKVIDELKYLTILFIDENFNSKEIGDYTLGNFFKEVIIAQNYQDGLKKLEENSIDLIIFDLLEDKNKNIEIIEAIQDKNKKNLPIIVMSKNEDEKYILNNTKLNIDGVFAKPFNIENFLTQLEIILDKKNTNILDQYSSINDLNLAVSKVDVNGIITYVNDSFIKLTGYEKEELLGKNYAFLKHTDTSLEFYNNIWENIKNKRESTRYTLKNLSKDNIIYYSKTTISPVFSKSGEVIEFICLSDNVTELMNPKKQLSDFSKSMNDFIYVLVKIEDYEIFTTLWGEKITDKLQKEVHKIILERIYEDNKYFKLFCLENGEYGLIKENNDLTINILEIISYIKEFQNKINSSKIAFDDLEFSVSILISFATEKTAIKDAPIGIKILEKEKTNFIVSNNLSQQAKINAIQNIKILEITKLAIEENKIICLFQPIIDNKTKEIIKYESLVRIIDANNEILKPDSFLGIVKKSKYYSSITSAVLESSFKALDYTDCDISINLSMLDIENEESCDKIIQHLKDNKHRAHRITFELLENENSRDFTKITTFIKTLKYLGVKIAIDDFGSGYSNFERIVQYQPDLIKIDGSLIRNIVNDKFSYDLVETIASFAKKQNIKTVAEFVENESIYDILSLLEIDYSQGYFFGKPEKLF